MSKRLAGILLGLGAALLILSFLIWNAGRDPKIPPEEQKGTELVELAPVETSPERVAVPGDSPEEKPEELPAESEAYEFVLTDNNNYVAVYRLPENLIYEYTDVTLDVLPEELQAEIREGKFLKNEAELYNFLENYTS